MAVPYPPGGTLTDRSLGRGRLRGDRLDRRHLGRVQFAMLGNGAIALGVFLSGFVISEPAPYELYLVGLIAIFGLVGALRISAGTAPLLVLLLLFNAGG
ncbi:MAG: hypothetical protein EOP19_29475, partial [Hyphomicrobiales bacterium]